MTPRLLLVVGLQKSGTSLLARLLQHAGLPTAGRGEGDGFLGNVPAHAPAGDPVGLVYQRGAGRAGHTVQAGDATAEVRAEVARRFAEAAGGAPVVLNKNPYNTVRLPWLRALFPDAAIVAMVRAPAPNVFSLTKKHHPHDGRGAGPQDGWWGVKPPDWQSLVDDDKVKQSARQWAAVNALLADDRDCLDAVVGYARLCAEPAVVLREVLALVGLDLDREVPPVRSADDEHRRGARLLSKNREYRRTGAFALPATEPVELGPFDAATRADVDAVCRATAERFAELS